MKRLLPLAWIALALAASALLAGCDTMHNVEQHMQKAGDTANTAIQKALRIKPAEKPADTDKSAEKPAESS